MTIDELNEKYFFHDSIVERITYDSEKKILELYLDFCFWAQTDYKNTQPETGKVIVRFFGVNDYTGITGESDWWGITDTMLENGTYTVVIDDDYHEVCHRLEINASEADFVTL
ncbi:MAG: hypothetical protein Q4F09_01515 [Erysipelotrichaceae bacterium]|nr:hypothetical protein [Erysipelotrichaceae bacterium]